MAVHVNKDNFEAEIKASKIPVVADFWAAWCGPCRMIAPVIDELSKEMANVKFVKINVDEEQELAANFGIMSIPTIIIFKNGKEIDRIRGFSPKEHMKKTINNIINANITIK